MCGESDGDGCAGRMRRRRTKAANMDWRRRARGLDRLALPRASPAGPVSVLTGGGCGSHPVRPASCRSCDWPQAGAEEAWCDMRQLRCRMLFASTPASSGESRHVLRAASHQSDRSVSRPCEHARAAPRSRTHLASLSAEGQQPVGSFHCQTQVTLALPTLKTADRSPESQSSADASYGQGAAAIYDAVYRPVRPEFASFLPHQHH